MKKNKKKTPSAKWSSSPPGIIRLNEGFHDRYPVEDFLDLFDHAAYQIQGNPAANANGSPRQANIIIGETEGSCSSWSSRQRNAKIKLLDEGADFTV